MQWTHRNVGHTNTLTVESSVESCIN